MKAWELFLQGLEQPLGIETVAKWLKPLQILRFDAANLYLSAQDSFQIAWFEEHIRPRLKGKFRNNNHRPITVHLVLPARISPIPSPAFTIESTFLDPDLTLDHFLVSPQNEIAYQLIQELEKKTFNPLLFYGPPSSGKTHLLTSAAHLLRKKNLRVFFTRAEIFTEHVVTAIRLQKMGEFRKVYREVDALIIEDIQMLKGKGATQEEFFHTFNELHTAGKHILLSANNPPSQLSEIEPRLISRFEWGISISLFPLDPKLILEEKCKQWKWSFSSALLDWLIAAFPSNPFPPFHALAVRSQTKPISLEVARILLQDFLKKEKPITPDQIMKAVAAHYGIRLEDLLGKSQTRECAVPRQIAMYLCREKLKLPFQRIGEIFQRDHSTVMASIEKALKGPIPQILI